MGSSSSNSTRRTFEQKRQQLDTFCGTINERVIDYERLGVMFMNLHKPLSQRGLIPVAANDYIGMFMNLPSDILSLSDACLDASPLDLALSAHLMRFMKFILYLRKAIPMICKDLYVIKTEHPQISHLKSDPQYQSLIETLHAMSEKCSVVQEIINSLDFCLIRACIIQCQSDNHCSYFDNSYQTSESTTMSTQIPVSLSSTY